MWRSWRCGCAEARRAARREAPEQVGGGRAGEIREDRTGHEATIGARGEPLEITARDLAEKIDLGLLGERFGAEGDDRGEQTTGGADNAAEHAPRRMRSAVKRKAELLCEGEFA